MIEFLHRPSSSTEKRFYGNGGRFKVHPDRLLDDAVKMLGKEEAMPYWWKVSFMQVLFEDDLMAAETRGRGGFQLGDDAGGLSTHFITEVLSSVTSEAQAWESGDEGLFLPVRGPLTSRARQLLRTFGRLCCMFFFRKTAHGSQFESDVFNTSVCGFVFDYICKGGACAGAALFSDLQDALAAVAEYDSDLAGRWSRLLSCSTEELSCMEVFLSDEGPEMVTADNREAAVLFWCEEKLLTSRREALDIVRDAFLELPPPHKRDPPFGHNSLQSLVRTALKRGQLQRFLCGEGTCDQAVVVRCLQMNDGWTVRTEQAFDDLKLVVGQLSEQQLEQFLRFVISSTGISTDANTVEGSLPTASTCTKTLAIPVGLCVGQLQGKLLEAINSTRFDML
jgi:hypothetical protein